LDRRTTPGPAWSLRGAAARDVEEIAVVWHRGWRDAHVGHVPEPLLAHRGLEAFRARVPSRLADTTVAVADDGRVLGFVAVHGDELEQLFVAVEARGTGAAAALLSHGERVIAAHFATAWLAVVEGNARARRFYARHGWTDAGPIDYAAEVDGGRVQVPTRRYEKRVAAGD